MFSRNLERSFVLIAFLVIFSSFLPDEILNFDPIYVVPAIEAVPSSSVLRDYWVKHYALKLGHDTTRLVAISHAENLRGIRDAWSPTGCCVGVMQVNMDWFGEFDEECKGSDLLDIRVNACYGNLIWRFHLRKCEGKVECALRDYVGQEFNILAGNFYVSEVERRMGETSEIQ